MRRRTEAGLHTQRRTEHALVHTSARSAKQEKLILKQLEPVTNSQAELGAADVEVVVKGGLIKVVKEKVEEEVTGDGIANARLDDTAPTEIGGFAMGIFDVIANPDGTKAEP